MRSLLPQTSCVAARAGAGYGQLNWDPRRFRSCLSPQSSLALAFPSNLFKINLLRRPIIPSPALLGLDKSMPVAPVSPNRAVSSSAVQPQVMEAGAAVPKLTGVEASKQLAAWTAVDRHIGPEHRVRICSGASILSVGSCDNVDKVIGIGSGNYVVAPAIPNSRIWFRFQDPPYHTSLSA